jgi:primosomal protein N' (replication factor Y) (superfamily II helicase)
MMAIARVEPLHTTRAVRGPFDYRLPEAMRDVGVGSMLVVPFGRQELLGVVVDLADRSEVAPERLVEPLRALEAGVPPELVRLALWVADAYCSTPARALGLVLPPGAGRLKAKQVLVASITDAGRRALADETRLTGAQRELLERLSAQALPAADAGHGRARGLEARGLVALERRVQHRRPVHVPVGARDDAERRLTADQRAAVAAIEAAPAGGRLLLHGVTGSGKTEVYLQAVAAALARGRGAIVLVPEIALTPQTVGRFERRFGDRVAVLHSQLGQGERHDEWQRLRRGEARICVGPRSAIFAPIDDLGLIVVDEEHDSSYKQEGDPRYDARTVAERRARACGAVLVAGSATPRPETVHRYERIALPRRVDGVALPPVEVLDMRGREGPLHPATREALAQTRRDGGKAIVLLNRRGWSNFLTCRGCGRVWECPHCDVALVLHRADGALACHHCGHRERAPERCGACGSTAVARHGAGTERLEHELAAALGDPSFPVFRLDSDVAAAKGRLAERLAAFEAAPAGVLVGTQMVAKGHDFPDVTLGIVLDADATLRFPDFRAEERTFALVAQLAGRAGRGARGGRVLVQTLAPEAEAIRFAARHDADGFLAAELARREALRYPPFAHLIRVVCAAEDLAAVNAAAEALHEQIGLPVLGPAPLFRLKGRERVQLVIKTAQRDAAVRAVGAAVDAVARAHRGVTLMVDVDPQ